MNKKANWVWLPAAFVGILLVGGGLAFTEQLSARIYAVVFLAVVLFATSWSVIGQLCSLHYGKRGIYTQGLLQGVVLVVVIVLGVVVI